jgi:hypothetical protein
VVAHARRSSGRTPMRPSSRHTPLRRRRSARTTGARPFRSISYGLLVSPDWIEEPAGRNDRNGLALAAQSGQSQGRPSTNSSSQLDVHSGLP